MRRLLVFILAIGVLLGGVATAFAQRSSPITLTFGGDVMLGRSVGPVAAADPHGTFRNVRHLLTASDLAFANLESPLTSRPHVSANPNVLVADPATASILSGAGFDVVSLANNHAADAGRGGIEDTVAALAAQGIEAVGAHGIAPLYVEVGGVTVAIIAIDADAPWDEAGAERTVTDAADRSDLLVVSVHGGVAFLPEPDPRIERLAERLVAWGADVIWGHGPHVVQPITTVTGDRTAIVATSLGNLLFDQRGPLTGEGALLQVRADRSGLLGHRLGRTSHHDLRVHFTGWDLPAGDAVAWDGEWWTPIRPFTPLALQSPVLSTFPWGEVVATGTGPITAGETELAVSFRQVPGAHPVRDGLTDVRWTDAAGRSYHLGIYRTDLTPVWVAGTVPAPIVGLAVCDGSLALAYATLDSPAVVATGGAVWRPVGLDAVDPLSGPGTPGCADIDGDGLTEPVIFDR